MLVLIILLAISGTSHYGLLDSYSTQYAKINDINVSNLRVYGSIAYVIGLITSGYVINLFGYGVSFIICSVLFTLTSIMYLIIKPIFDEIKNHEEKRNYKEVFSNKGYLLFLIYYVFMFGIQKASNNYYGLLLESKGISSSGYGYVYAMGVVMEVITLILFNKLNKKLNFKILLLIAIASIAIQNMINGSNLSVYVIISSYILRGIAYGILLHVNYKILVNLVGVKNSTIVILLEELGINILVIIANAIGGNIIENISYNAYYLILGSMAFLDLIYYLIFVQKYVIKNDKIEVVNV